MLNFIAGIGGRDVTPKDLTTVFEKARKTAGQAGYLSDKAGRRKPLIVVSLLILFPLLFLFGIVSEPTFIAAIGTLIVLDIWLSI